MWLQSEIKLRARARGFHLITSEVIDGIPGIRDCRVGLLNILIKHTSASLTVNENADPSVRVDFESYFSRLAPENEPYFEHTLEGSDDMPAHLKSSLLGASLVLPVTDGHLNLGTWQGIYLCEHRNQGGARTLVITLNGDI